MDFQGKKVTVLGARETGIQSALFLKQKGARVFLSELKGSKEFIEVKKVLEQNQIECEFGQHTWEDIEDSDLVILSPGIPPTAEIYQKVTRANIPVWSEIELAFRFSPSPLIAVTGSNGKTTVTTLIRDVLRASGRKAISCGNIGNSYIGEIDKLNPDIITVVEVSSFQLAHIDRFRPGVAVLLNLSPNHLDWHSSFEEYAETKCRIFKNQTSEDYSVVNLNDDECQKRSANLASKVICFNASASDNPNFAAIEQVGQIYGIESQVVRSVLDNFTGLEHRFELSSTIHGVKYINDSKSTTIASLGWALERVEDQTILICGGRHKGGDFRVLRSLLAKKVKFLILIGESKKQIESALSDLVTTVSVETLEDALKAARAASKPGDSVLFSPACASFDMFKDYQDRGRQFKSILTSWQGELASLSHR